MISFLKTWSNSKLILDFTPVLSIEYAINSHSADRTLLMSIIYENDFSGIGVMLLQKQIYPPSVHNNNSVA